MNIKNKQVGFTLIEVLIALIILAIALTAIIKATQDSIRDTTRVQDRLIAHWVAMNVVAKIQIGLLAVPGKTAPEKGTENMMGRIWPWQAAVDVGGNPFYERIHVDVYRPDEKIRVEHLLAFVRLRHEKNTR